MMKRNILSSKEKTRKRWKGEELNHNVCLFVCFFVYHPFVFVVLLFSLHFHSFLVFILLSSHSFPYLPIFFTSFLCLFYISFVCITYCFLLSTSLYPFLSFFLSFLHLFFLSCLYIVFLSPLNIPRLHFHFLFSFFFLPFIFSLFPVCIMYLFSL